MNKFGFILEVSGNFANFKKDYATSSQPSFSVPPLTTIQGMFGAILGLKRDSYYDIFDGVIFGLELKNNALSKRVIALNNIDTSDEFFKNSRLGKGLIGQRNRVPIEFIEKLDFYLYVFINDLESFVNKVNANLYQFINKYTESSLIDFLKSSNSIFSINLGKAFNLASYKFIEGINKYEIVEIKDKTRVRTAVNININKIKGSSKKFIYEVDIPSKFSIDSQEGKKRRIKGVYNLIAPIDDKGEKYIEIVSGKVIKLGDQVFVSLLNIF